MTLSAAGTRFVPRADQPPGGPAGAPLATALFLAGALPAAVVAPMLLAYAFPVAAVVFAVLLWLRGRPVGVVEFLTWLYLAAPFIRRVDDWRGGYHPNSLVLVAAPAASLVGLLGLRGTRYVRRWVALVFLGAALTTAMAAVVGVSLNGLVAAGTQFAQWGCPFIAAFLVLLAPDQGAYLAMIRRVTRYGLLVLGGYGVAQFFILPPWDATWMRNVSVLINTVGSPYPLQVRVFSTMSSPATLAGTLSVLLVVAVVVELHDVTAYVGFGLAVVTLGLSLVRAGWIAFAASLLVLVLARRGRAWRYTVVIAGLLGLILLFGGPVATTISDRFSQSTSAGSQDESYDQRVAFQTQELPAALHDLPGAGFGSSGTAVRRQSTPDAQAAFSNTDSGYLDILHIYGSPLGLAYLAIMLAGVFAFWRTALRRPAGVDGRTMVGLAAGLVVTPVALLFGSTTTELGGLLLWTGLASAGALRDSRPFRRPAAPEAPAGLAADEW